MGWMRNLHTRLAGQMSVLMPYRPSAVVCGNICRCERPAEGAGWLAEVTSRVLPPRPLAVSAGLPPPHGASVFVRLATLHELCDLDGARPVTAGSS